MKISTVLGNLIDLLEADPFFADPDPTKVVTVVAKKAGDIEALIAEKLQEIGVGLLVVIRVGKRATSDGLELTLKFALTAVENPIVNETGKTAEDIAENAMEILEGKHNGVSIYDESELGRFVVDDDALQPIPPPIKKAFLNLHMVNIKTTIALTPR